MFSTVQQKFTRALSYFGYGSELSKGLPEKVYNSLESQNLEQPQATLKAERITPITSKPPSIWKRVASLGMSYLFFSSGQSSLQETLSSGVLGYTSDPGALPLTFVAGLSIFPEMSCAQSLETTFFKALGGIDSDEGNSITITPEGDFIVAGFTLSFGAANLDVLLSKFASNGTLLWAFTLGGAENDASYDVAATLEGGLIITGYTASFGAGGSDVLLAKLSSNGTLLWANTLGGTNNEAGWSIITTPEGDFIVAGYTAGFGAGSDDVLLSKFSSNGSLLWVKTLGGISDDFTHALTVTSEGDLIIAGYTASFGAGSEDMLLAKFSKNGTLVWAKTLGETNEDQGYALTATPEGDLIVTGYTDNFGAGSEDMLLSKFSRNGTLVWAKTLGEINEDQGFALTITPEGDFIVGGYTRTAEGSNITLSKFSSDGTFVWANTLSGAGFELAEAIMATPEGGFIVVGYTSTLIVGGSDVIVAKLNAQGSIENCSAWQSVTPQVQSITPNVADVTLNMTIGIPPWTVQDARSALNVTDITNLLNQTTVCYEQTAVNRTLATSLQASLSSETPSPNSRESGSVSSSPSMTRSSSYKATDNSSLMSSLPSPSTLKSTGSPASSTSGGATIPSITTFVYGESYSIIVNGQTIGSFYFTGGSGQLDSNNPNTLNIQLEGNIEDGETIILFTIPEGEEPQWEDIILSDGSESGCITTEGVFTTTSEEEHSYQLIFEYESSECSYAAAIKLAGIPVLSGGVL